MTADEIRKTQFDHDDGAWESAHWLKEIAAQLADLNEKLHRVAAINEERRNRDSK